LDTDTLVGSVEDIGTLVLVHGRLALDHLLGVGHGLRGGKGGREGGREGEEGGREW
jgi:hypothetical protein